MTSNDEHAKAIRMLRDWGQEKRYHHVLKGFNYRMEGFQGAILRVKLRHLEKWTEARRERARQYDALLAGSSIVRTPKQLDDRRHVYHIYAVRSADRDGLQRQLQAEGIANGSALSDSGSLAGRARRPRSQGRRFPASEAAANEVLSLPMFPEMTATQVEQVVAAVLQEASV